MANRAHHNFRFTMETVPEGEAAGVQRFMDNFDISKPIEERIDPDFVTDYLVERFTIAGTPQECIAKVKKLEADGIQRILLTPPNAIYDQVMYRHTLLGNIALHKSPPYRGRPAGRPYKSYLRALRITIVKNLRGLRK